jgi:small-conductance mechanosensitive channel
LKSLVENTIIINPLLNFLIFWLSVNLIIRLSQIVYRKRKKYGHKYSDNVISGLKNIYYLLVSIGVFVMVLGIFGLEPVQLLTSISIVAAAIAIISKELVMDIICGMNISFSRELAIGDYVQIGERRGTVIDINIYKIILQTDYDEIIHISNGKAYYSDIVNFTQKEIRKCNLDFSLASSKKISKAQLKETIEKITDRYTSFIEAGSATFNIISIEKEAFTYKFQFNLLHLDPIIEREIKSKILEKIHSLILEHEN